MEPILQGLFIRAFEHQLTALEQSQNFDESSLVCKKCKEKFVSIKGLSIHLTKIHDTSPKIFACLDCFKSYRSDSELKIHRKKVHLNTTKISCQKCDKSFSSKSAFQAHSKKFHPLLPSIN